MDEKYTEAIKIYNDVEDFFSTKDGKEYLKQSISLENLWGVLEELTTVFIEIEDYEKCSQLQKWKRTLCPPENLE